MTSDDRDYDATVRRALHAAAESVEPADDGLERIRHRITSPRGAAPRAHAFVAWFRLAAIRRLVRAEPAAAGLRPMLAVAGAVAIVIAGAFALGRVQQFVTPANSVSTPGTSHHPPSARSSTPAETGAWTLPIGVEPGPATGDRSGSSNTGVLPVIADTPTPTPTASTPSPTASTPSPTASTPSPTASQRSPTMSATPTPSNTDTPTVTPAPTNTDTPTPTDTAAPTVTPAPTDTDSHAAPADRHELTQG